MKVIIQIPCYNEEKTLPITLRALPRSLAGIDVVEWLVIDDGSTDDTVNVAKQHGVDHVISHPKNLGLARTFMTGLNTALKMGADIIVNTDADNQYSAADIPKLILPILEGKAEIVIGERPIKDIPHFSGIKKILQRIGSSVVRYVSKTEIPDAPSGFRAISRNAALQLNVFNEYTYTLETIIQAGIKNMAVRSVPITVNEDLRPSRLVKSIPAYVQRSILTILRIFVVYKPLRFFMFIGVGVFSSGFLIGLRFLYYFSIGSGSGHIQSLILAAVLLIIGFQIILVGILSDLVAVNRKILEDIQYRVRKLEID